MVGQGHELTTFNRIIPLQNSFVYPLGMDQEIDTWCKIMNGRDDRRKTNMKISTRDSEKEKKLNFTI